MAGMVDEWNMACPLQIWCNSVNSPVGSGTWKFSPVRKRSERFAKSAITQPRIGQLSLVPYWTQRPLNAAEGQIEPNLSPVFDPCTRLWAAVEATIPNYTAGGDDNRSISYQNVVHFRQINAVMVSGGHGL